MTTEQKVLYDLIDKLPWVEWDPIGINDFEEACDEYQGYTPQIFRLKIGGANELSIANLLFEIGPKSMGLVGIVTIAIRLL